MIIFIFNFFIITSNTPAQVTFDINTKVDSFEYKATVYKPTEAPINAILVISPTILGIQSVEISNAQYFSKRGYVVIIPHPFYTELNNPTPITDNLDRDYYRPVTSIISFLNVVEDRLKLPLTIPVFALGASHGGITTILITAYIPRVRAAWFAVAGGDLPHIYAHSTVEQLVEFRTNHMRVLGINNNDQYETYLRGYLKNDPAQSCKDIKVPFHQTIALKDTSVPTIDQELLVDECPPHAVLRKNLSHGGGVLTTVTMRKDIKEFFDSFILFF